MTRGASSLLSVLVTLALPSCAALVSFAGLEGGETLDASTAPPTDDAGNEGKGDVDAAKVGADASAPEGDSGGDGAAGNDGGGSLQYLGCFADSQDRDLPYPAYDASSNTPALCVATCADAGYMFAATQNGSECFCGNAYGGQGPSGGCRLTCSDDAGLCGGPFANSVYTRSSVVIPVPSFIGCFNDNGSARDLSGLAYSSDFNTTAACVAYCVYHGYLYAGTQSSLQCFCGDSYGKYGSAANCINPCPGDSVEFCGGEYENSVYRTSVADAGKDSGPPDVTDAGKEAAPPDASDGSAEQ